MEDHELAHALKERMGRARENLARLENEYRQALDRFERERKLIDNLAALLLDLGVSVEDVRGQTSIAQAERIATEPANPIFGPGNRSSKTPARYPEFATMSLRTAAGIVLSRSNQEMHTKDVARTIYMITDENQLTEVSANLRSTMKEGADKGLWKRGDRPAVFQSISSEERGGTQFKN